MKRIFSTFAALALAATFSAAQTRPSMAGQAASQQEQQQQPQVNPQTPPPGQTTPGQTPTQPAGKKRPEAKSQEEFQDFQKAQASATPDALEQAADAFAKKYPASELRALLYSHAMMMYEQQNIPDKLVDVAQKIVAIDPNDPLANVFIATFVPERVRDTDLDKDEKYAEASKAAETALANVDNMPANPDAAPERVEANKNLLRSMAYTALGTIALNKNDNAGAEKNLKQAIDAGKGVNSDPVMYLRYAVALDHDKKYQEALPPANKALELSPQGSAYYKLASQERERLMALMGSNTAPKPTTTTPPPPQASPTTPQVNPTTPK